MKTECERHPELMAITIESRDLSLANKLTLNFFKETIDSIVATQAEHGKKIEETNRIITNGMRMSISSIEKSIAIISTDLQEFISSTRESLNIINRFKWFRDGMNKFRDNFIFIFFTMVMLVLAGLFVIHFNDVIRFIK